MKKEPQVQIAADNHQPYTHNVGSLVASAALGSNKSLGVQWEW